VKQLSNEIYELTISLRGRDRYEKLLAAIDRAMAEDELVLYEREVQKRILDPDSRYTLRLDKLRGRTETDFSIPAYNNHHTTTFDVHSGHWRGGRSGLVQKRDDVSADLGQGRGYCKGFEDGVQAATIREERRKAEKSEKRGRKTKPNFSALDRSSKKKP
jgi:hypothetical protein